MAAPPPPPNASLGIRLERRGLDESLWSRAATDAYHLLRESSWTTLTLSFGALYLGLNLVFAAVLWLGDAKLLNAEPGFWPRFVFSVQTMATIGYGYMAPDDLLAHLVVTVESFVGILFNAMVTGVFFGKFSTPRAKVRFSSRCVVAVEEGVPTWMFRCANGRSTAILEATVRVALTRDEVLSHGERVRRIYDLELRRNTSPLFAASWTVYHPITERSPLYGRSPKQVEDENTAIIVTFTGLDDSLVSTVHARQVYPAVAFRWGARFVDMMGEDPDGTRFVDFARLDDTREARLP